MAMAIIVSVAIACFTILLTVLFSTRLTNRSVERVNRHTTETYERMAQRSDESGERMLTRMESGYMRHFSALVYAMDKASRERRPLTREDLQEGLKIARQVEDIDQEVTQDP